MPYGVFQLIFGNVRGYRMRDRLLNRWVIVHADLLKDHMLFKYYLKRKLQQQYRYFLNSSLICSLA